MCLQSDSGWGVVTKASSPCLGSDAGYPPVYPPGACPWGLGWVLEVRLPGDTESQTKLSSLYGRALVGIAVVLFYLLEANHYGQPVFKGRGIWAPPLQGRGTKKCAATCEACDTSLSLGNLLSFQGIRSKWGWPQGARVRTQGDCQGFEGHWWPRPEKR